MTDKPIFVIGEQHAGRDVFFIARDLNVNQNSPAGVILNWLSASLQRKQHQIGQKLRVSLSPLYLNK